MGLTKQQWYRKKVHQRVSGKNFYNFLSLSSVFIRSELGKDYDCFIFLLNIKCTRKIFRKIMWMCDVFFIQKYHQFKTISFPMSSNWVWLNLTQISSVYFKTFYCGNKRKENEKIVNYQFWTFQLAFFVIDI
jgi:hypothetical protein